MRRRDFIGLAGGLAAWPLPAWAQRPTMPLIGYLSSASESADVRVVRELKKGLAELGFVEGNNVAVIGQWSDGDYSKLGQLANELVARKVDVIVSSGFPATLAAQKATSTIPIVFRFAVDPVAYGLVQSFDRPGGNLTGATMLFDPLTPKKLQLLHELVGDAAIGFLVNPKNQNVGTHLEHAATAVKALGLKLVTVNASRLEEIEPAFAMAKRQSAAAVLLGDDPLFFTRKDDVVRAAAAHRMPTMYYVRDFADAGGLMSYGPRFDEMAQHTGRYAGRILSGAKPADLPVLQPTRFELVLNLKTARAQGISIPATLQASADEALLAQPGPRAGVAHQLALIVASGLPALPGWDHAFQFVAQASTDRGTLRVANEADGQHVFANIDGGAPDMDIIVHANAHLTANDFIM